MLKIWLITAAIMAGISLIVMMFNVFSGYSDGWLTSNEKKSLKIATMVFLASPLGIFIIPVVGVSSVAYLLFMFIRGVIVYGFIKPSGKDDEDQKIANSYYM